MHGSARPLFSDLKDPLLRVLDVVRPHTAAIRAAWRKKLDALGLGVEEIEAFASLALDSQQQSLESGGVEKYRMDLERQAQVLQSKGLSEAHVAAAVALYAQCCVPYLFGKGSRARELVGALSQWIPAAQWVLLGSYSEHQAASYRRLQERERHNLSRDLHDDIGHNLLVLKLYLEIMAMDLKKGEMGQLESKLEEALALVSYAVDSVRRLMLDLGPAMLSQFGFERALQIYARQFALRTGIDLRVDESSLPEKLPSGHETALYRVLQGAFSNIVQHSRAKHVKVTIGATKRSVVLSIEDDGVGFDVAGTLSQKAFGLMAMRERIEILGGKFHIDSWPSRPGARRHGTRIEIDLPLPN